MLISEAVARPGNKQNSRLCLLVICCLPRYNKQEAKDDGSPGVMLSSDLSRDYSTAEKYFKASLTVDAYNEEIEHE